MIFSTAHLVNKLVGYSRQLSRVFVRKDDDMHVAMFQQLPSSFINSSVFATKVLEQSVWVVELVRGLSCPYRNYAKIRLKWWPLPSQWTRFLLPDMFLHVYQVLFHCLVRCIDLSAKLTQQCSYLSLGLHVLLSLEPQVTPGRQSGFKLWCCVISNLPTITLQMQGQINSSLEATYWLPKQNNSSMGWMMNIVQNYN